MSETTKNVNIAGRSFSLRASQVERSMRMVLPEPLRDHFIVVGRRRYPPKQVLGEVTGLDRAEFTTHHARRILTGLGFAAGRRSADPTQGTSAGSSRVRRGAVDPRPTADALEPFVGQWVATKGREVLVAAPEPRAVVGWLAEHGLKADSMFRVPADELEASGATPS
jgi:hypothetical protein